ncbi:ABC transporter substrate-binding protein [Kribbella sp. GL6]|uniref:ABC transporter substrate-binding protein n=1 Tax=Kribbella sp. GL6 TaxID=3419765 RepID=UPI003CFF9D98
MSRKALRPVVIAAVAILTGALLAACSSSGKTSNQGGNDAAGSSFPLTITDASGQKLTLQKKPEAIGCYWTGCDEILAALGVVPHASPNAVDTTKGKLIYPNGLPEQDVNKLGGEDNAESWAKAGVDLIVTRGPASPEVKAFEAVAPVLYLYAPGLDDSGKLTGLEAYKKNVELMGQVTGKVAEAKAANDGFDTFMTKLASKAPAGAADTTVAPIFQTDDGTYQLIAPTSAFCVALNQYKLGKCAESSARNATSWVVNSEAFLALNPGWIPYMGGANGTALDWKRRGDAVWKQLTAVKDQHVYNATSRIFCCSLRTLAPSLQEYAYNAWGANSGIADPGKVTDYVYADDYSPLSAK